jgi:hypothetical protein
MPRQNAELNTAAIIEQPSPLVFPLSMEFSPHQAVDSLRSLLNA